MDAAYQGLVRGIIPTGENSIKQNEINEINTVADNYRFVRKYFAPHWYLYVLLIRLLTLHNPVREIWCFCRMLKVRSVNLYTNRPVEVPDNVELISTPMVSVVIPTLNRYEYLKDVLSDLEKQDYKNFEVLVCDQSDEYNQEFYNQWSLSLRIIRQSEKALWLARNSCIVASSGTLIALTEDDVRIKSDWLSSHLNCIESFSADASCGIFFPEGEEPIKSQKYYKLSDSFATGNTLIKKNVFETTGLFDRQFEGQRMGDGEFGLRCILSGFKIIQNPVAYCIDMKAPTGGLRQMGSWDSIRTRKLFDARPVPSVLYYIRTYFGKKSAIIYIIQNVPYSLVPYRFRKNKFIKRIYLILFIFFWPFLLFSIVKSWRSSTNKIKIGKLISKLYFCFILASLT